MPGKGGTERASQGSKAWRLSCATVGTAAAEQRVVSEGCLGSSGADQPEGTVARTRDTERSWEPGEAQTCHGGQACGCAGGEGGAAVPRPPGSKEDLSSAGLWGPAWGHAPTLTPGATGTSRRERGNTWWAGGSGPAELGARRPEGASQGCAPPHAPHPGSGYSGTRDREPHGGGSMKSWK